MPPRLRMTHLEVHRRRPLWALLTAVVVASACTPVRPPEPAPKPIDVEQESLRTEFATKLERPRRILFDWAIRESALRLSGSGLARVEPPYRARLDLFLGNGERAAAAALVDGDLRIPTGVASQVIPPPHLLWGTLGVFRPGYGVALLGGETVEGRLRLRYRLDNGDEVHWYMRDRRVEQVDVLRAGSVIQDVRLELDDTGIPMEAVYRDLTAFRELTITRREVEDVEPFPPDVWEPRMGAPRPHPDARRDGM